MRIPRKPRQINPELREGVARKHARYMEMFGDDDWKKIDRKIQEFGNDYYRTDLFEDRATMVQAIDDFETYRTGTPAMNIVAEDMRQFYGLTPAKAPIQPEIAAEIQRQDYVNNTLGYNVQEKYDNLIQDNLLKNNDNDVDHLEMALLLAAALGTGGVIKGVTKEDEEKKLSELRPS